MKTLLLSILLTFVTCFAYATDPQRLLETIQQLNKDELAAEQNLKQTHDIRIELIGRYKERLEVDSEIEALKKEIEGLKKGKTNVNDK